MAYITSYMNGGNCYSGQKWFHFSGPGGTVSERASYEAAARAAAADRLRCEEDELTCTGWEPVTVTYKIER